MDKGASPNEQLLAAAKQDSEELLLQVFEASEPFDINFQDGLGFTALHYAIQRGSTDVLDPILEHVECDVDPQTRIDQDTPLHLAMRVQDFELRTYLVRSLLESGADTTIVNKYKQTPLDLLTNSTEDEELRRLVGEEVALLERIEEENARQAGRGVGGVDLGDVVQDDSAAGPDSGSDSD